MQRQLYTQDISSRQTHHNLQASATLNRRYVRRPASYLTTPQGQLKNNASRVSSLSQSTSNQPQSIAEQRMVQKATDSNSVNITFKHKIAKETPAKKPISISVSQPSMPRSIDTPQPKKIMVLDNIPAVEKNTRQVKLEEKDSTTIFDHQAKMDRAFSLVSEQEQSILNKTIQPTPIFTNSFKRRKLLNARAKALAKHEKATIKSTKKASFSARPAVAPISIPATNMTATSVESAFSHMQRLDHLDKQAAKTTHATIKPVASIKTKTASSSKTLAKHNKGARVLFAFLCSSAVVAALFFVVQSNMPDISIKVAAMQTGIQATYPSYVPRDYRLSGVYTAQDNSVAMDFLGPNQAKFTLTEEKLPWDSTALLNRFVRPKWGEDFTTIKEQGITIYISGSNAAWVNAGIVYKITNFHGELTKKQIKNIVTSL
jgi:hypothetical protein cdivTM_05795